MRKVCSSCGEEKDSEKDFSWRYKDRGIRQPRCKDCQSELSKLHYQNNKQIYNERTRAYKARTINENISHIHSYLATHPCVDCGQTNILVLEFDHVRGQKFGEVGDLVRNGCNWFTIETEIAKCEVRCANCHHIKTAEYYGSWRNLKQAQQQTKTHQQIYIHLSGHPCIDCGYSDILALEFDHVRGHKTKTISRLLTQGYKWSAIANEIAKCEVRCANCHRIKTSERGGFWRNLFDL